MGYESHWAGQVHITPPLTWAEIKNDRSKGFQDLKLRLDEHTEDTPTGQVRTVTAAVIEPLTGSAYNGYAIEAELQSVIDAHPGHEFAGAIEAKPLDPGGTPWRYVIQGRTVARQEPTTVWPGEEAADLERARRIAVALEQENAHLTAELAEERASHDPRLRGLLVKAAPDEDLYVQWSTVCDMPGGVFNRETALEYGFLRSKVDHADEHGSSSRHGDGHWDDKGWVAEQRGWLRRDRIGEYAVKYLNGDEQAAFDLLEPFEGESEVRR
jgi:hypothetical protein